MALPPAQPDESAPRLAGIGEQTTKPQKLIRLDCADMLCGQMHLRQPCARKHKLQQVADASKYASGECNYKDALLAAVVDQCARASDARKEAFEAHLKACGFTTKSKAFMHAELAHLLHTMRVEDCSLIHTRQCPAHVRALLARVPVLAQALFVLCEDTSTRHVFDVFVLSMLEHMVLVEDVIASGGKVPNARAQCCARYVEDWTQAVALLASGSGHCFSR